MLRRIAWGFAGLVAVVVIGVPLWVHTHRKDLLTPGDEDLVAVGTQHSERLPEGFDRMREAVRLSQGLDDSEQLKAMTAREAVDAVWLPDLVQRNRAALTALEQAVALSGRIPRDPGALVPDEVLDVLLRVPRLVRLAAAEAAQLGHRGRWEAAFERAQLGLRVGHALSRYSDPTLIAMMTGVACQSISLRELEALVRESSLSARDAKALAQRIESHRITADSWRTMWAVEYQLTKATFARVQAADAAGELAENEDAAIWLRWIPQDYVYQPNRTLSLFAQYARQRQQGSGLSCRDASWSAPLSQLRMLEILFAPNPGGRILVEIATPNFNSFELKRCHTESMLGLVQASAALRAYTQAEGTLPDSLDALVPAYLDAVPLDRYDGAPLRYSKAKGIVYSIGDDFVDAGGAEPPLQSERSEPTISVAF